MTVLVYLHSKRPFVQVVMSDVDGIDKSFLLLFPLLLE